MDTTVEVTAILRRITSGDDSARNELYPLVYRHLRDMAGAQMSRERPGHTLQPTALINEAYLRLVQVKDVDWVGRGHFFGVAAKVMRQILVTHARAKYAKKRGGQKVELDLERQEGPWSQPAPLLLSLNQAMERLEKHSPRAYQLVELKYFAGMDFDEAAEALGVSSRTLKRDWKTAKKWLQREIEGLQLDEGSQLDE